MGKNKYSVNAAGAIEWVPSPSITSYYFDRITPMARWMRLHTRNLNVAAYGSTKAVPPTDGSKEVKVTVTIIPPLILEVCERSGGRLMLEVTCNVMTLNDMGNVKLPPAFGYAEEDAQSFVAATRHAIAEMSLKKKAAFSSAFRQQLKDKDYAMSSDSEGEE